MNKKEFYEAPKWGTRVVMVERHILEGSITYNEDGNETPSEGGDETF